MDGRRVRAATRISRAWRSRPNRRVGFKLSRMACWRPSTVNRPGGDYKFVRTASSNATGNVFSISTDALGVPKFFVGANNADNFQLDFALQQFVLRLGGTAQITSVTPDYSEFTTLFDQYKIDKVDVMLIPTYTNTGITANVTQQLPVMVYALDDDDSAAASKLVLQEYGNARYTTLSNAVMGDPRPLVTFQPKPAQAIYQTGATFAYGEISKGPKWIDVSYPSVPHYSFKAALDGANTTGTPNTVICYIDVVVKYHYSFKTVR